MTKQCRRNFQNAHSSDITGQNIRAGFWIRFAATWIDFLLIFSITFLIIFFGCQFHTYIPFELIFIILALSYSLICLTRCRQTFGKIICGLTVRKKNDNTSIGFSTAFVREFIGKFSVEIIFPIGMAWVVSSRVRTYKKLFPIIAFVFVILTLILFLIHYLLKKRTWYDLIARTIVVQNYKLKKRSNFVVCTILIFGAGLLGLKSFELLSILKIAGEMSSYAISRAPYENRVSSLREIETLAPSKDSEFVEWLGEYGNSPTAYAVERAQRHQVLIFGESHFNRSHVKFLSKIIPRLYRQAGVTCIAVEFCNREDNEKIHRLITASNFDRKLLLQIARNQN